MKAEIDTTESCTCSIIECILKVISMQLLFKKCFIKTEGEKKQPLVKRIVPQWYPHSQQWSEVGRLLPWGWTEKVWPSFILLSCSEQDCSHTYTMSSLCEGRKPRNKCYQWWTGLSHAFVACVFSWHPKYCEVSSPNTRYVWALLHPVTKQQLYLIVKYLTHCKHEDP